MAKLKRLLHTRYRVNDLEKTVAFYRDLLGLVEVSRHKSPRGSELVFLQLPAASGATEPQHQIELCCFPAAGPVQVQPDLTHLAFAVDDLREFARELAKKGVALSDGPTQTSSGSWIAFVDAPEGYEIELIQKAAR